MDILIAGLYGLVLGSFINVVVLRLDRKEGIITGRSECPHCGHILAWYDLVPLVSFFMLGGKCRYCQQAISWQYPLVEVGTGCLAALFVYQYPGGYTWQQLISLVGMMGFWALFLFDLKYFILPDKIIFPLITLSVVGMIFFNSGMLINALLTGLLLAGSFDILYVASGGRWMGFGDVKLALLIGLFFGYPVAVIVTVSAVWIAALFGLALIILGKATPKTALPFGSFMAVTAISAILFYNDLIFFRIFFP